MNHKYKYQCAEFKNLLISFYAILSFISLHVHVHACEMCTHICMCMGTHMYGCTMCIHVHGDQRWIRNAFPDGFILYLLRQGLFLNPELITSDQHNQRGCHRFAFFAPSAGIMAGSTPARFGHRFQRIKLGFSCLCKDRFTH